MTKLKLLSVPVCVFALSMLLAVPALAQRPDGVGGGKPERQSQQQGQSARGEPQRSNQRAETPPVARDERRDAVRVSSYFTDHHRNYARNYYIEQIHAGHCPPGLAKKRNGCMPPGQAKKWRIGQPLARDVIFFDPPTAIIIELGAPPPMHRYVRVDTDLLLIELATGMVIDAIEDLGRR
jgi:hypothetical protein